MKSFDQAHRAIPVILSAITANAAPPETHVDCA
jgi:hypothetical protein